MKYWRAIHRLVTVVVVLVTIYLAVTGSVIQMIDLHSILTKVPASDPNVVAMREAFDGPGNYAVRAIKDYTASALPADADYSTMLAKTLESARLTVSSTPLRYVEFRMEDGKPVGIVESAGRLAAFDPSNGQIIRTGPSARTDSDSPESERNTWKHLHRMTGFGHLALYINVIVGVGLSVMIATGLVIYFKMLRARSRSAPTGPFWSGGGAWRTWHRRISVVAAIFLVVVSLSGLWLAYESLVFGAYFGSPKQRAEMAAFSEAQRKRNGAPAAPRPDPMSAEAEGGRLAGLQHDLGLNADQMIPVKAVMDSSVQTYADLHKSGVDPQEARAKTMAMHQGEANAILAVLPDAARPKFQAWRDAQLLGTPLPAGGPRGARGNGPQEQRPTAEGPNPQRASGPQGNSVAAGGPGGSGGPGAGGPGRGGPGGPGGPGVNFGGGGGGGMDPSSPLVDADLPGMLKTTLDAERERSSAPIKVVRLRYYAGMPQGVVVTGGSDNKQMVYNAKTGRAVTETEPGYPPAGFPFGWQAHQWAKDVHRGGFFGLTGRMMDLLSGLAMFYLSVSGVWIYVEMWKRRRKVGKANPVWV